MIYSVIFVFCFVFCYIQLLLLRKVQRRISLVHSLVLCFITQICLGSVVAQILSVLSVRVDLMRMSIAYFIISIAFAIWNIKMKEIQRYSVESHEIFSVIIIALGVGCVFLRVFTPEIVLAYQNSDPAVHFDWAMQVVKTGKISSMYFASLYNALVVELGKPFVAEINCYKLFVLADTLANFINVLMFYCVADRMCRSKIVKVCLPFFALLYFMGWPFYSYAIGGFVYFGWGVTLIAYVLYLLLVLEGNNENRQLVMIGCMILVGCFCTVICYMLFAPILALVVLFSIVHLFRGKGIRINRAKLTVGIAAVLGIGVAAFCIAFFGFFGGNAESIIEALRTDGWIHNELYKDFLYLLPVALYMYYIRCKEKGFWAIYTTFAVVLIYIVITFVCSIWGWISAYYFYKGYYVFWLVCWLICIDGMEYMLTKERILVYIYAGFALFISAITLLGLDTSAVLREKNLVPNVVVSGENPAALSLYGKAHEFITRDGDADLMDKEAFIDMCQYLCANEMGGTSILLTSSSYLGKWFHPFTEGERIWVNTRSMFEEALNEVKTEKVEFVVIHQNTDIYRNNSDLMKGYESIYDNGYFGVYRLQR